MEKKVSRLLYLGSAFSNDLAFGEQLFQSRIAKINNQRLADYASALRQSFGSPQRATYYLRPIVRTGLPYGLTHALSQEPNWQRFWKKSEVAAFLSLLKTPINWDGLIRHHRQQGGALTNLMLQILNGSHLSPLEPTLKTELSRFLLLVNLMSEADFQKALVFYESLFKTLQKKPFLPSYQETPLSLVRLLESPDFQKELKRFYREDRAAGLFLWIRSLKKIQ